MNRFTAIHGDVQPALEKPWSLTHLTPPSALFGANGMQFGPDGRLYVAQAMGSQVTAIDTRNGDLEVIAANGGPITGPDDVAFDSAGNMYSTEVMSAQVTMRAPDGTVTVVADNLPSANGVTVFNDRLFIDEHRPGGRLFELYPHDDRPPRLIADDLDDPNALAGGPDGKLYFPLVAPGEIWRADPESGELEKVTEGLAFPTAAKFTPSGELVSPQAGNGEVVKIDVNTGEQTIVAKVRPGIDNLAFDADGNLFLSHFIDGGVAEVAMDGSNRERVLVKPGWVGPWGIACDTSGIIFIMDGLSLGTRSPEGEIAYIGGPLDKTAPRFVRAVAAGNQQTQAGTMWMTTARGDVLHYNVANGTHTKRAIKLGILKGICPTAGDDILTVRNNPAKSNDGAVLRISSDGSASEICTGLNHPSDVLELNGKAYVSESGAGKVLSVDGNGATTTILDGLDNPRGLASINGLLYVLDRGNRSLIEVDVSGSGKASTIASDLPIGAICPLDLAGGLASDHNGGLLIAADGEGSVLRLQQK